MNSKALVVKTLLVAAGLLIAGTALVNAAAGTAVPAKNAPAAAPEPKIPGYVIKRSTGGYLSLAVVDGKLTLTFYDAHKKQVPADVARARARFAVRYKATEERIVLNPTADGSALTSAQFIRPPYIYRIFLTLFAEGNDEPVEHYVENFRQ
jgi:hypothetical protein